MSSVIAHHARPAFYVERVEFRELILTYRHTGAVPDRLVEVLNKVAADAWDRRLRDSGISNADFVQECWPKFLTQVLPKCDPARNPHALFLTAAIRLALNLLDKHSCRRRHEDRYRRLAKAAAAGAYTLRRSAGQEDAAARMTDLHEHC
mgnify:CR=1 FL=1